MPLPAGSPKFAPVVWCSICGGRHVSEGLSMKRAIQQLAPLGLLARWLGDFFQPRRRKSGHSSSEQAYGKPTYGFFQTVSEYGESRRVLKFYQRRAAIAAMAFRYAKHHPGDDYGTAAIISVGINDACPKITGAVGSRRGSIRSML
jgi:hypothetical protein